MDSLQDIQRLDRELKANDLFPEGCKCGNNGGGDCEWCQVYYGWDEGPVRIEK